MSVPKKLCLLVVDDEPEVCDSVYHLLRRDYQILRATSAADAVKLMEQHEVDIIMTDQRMPEMTGVDMLKTVHSQFPEAIRILFTGYSDIRSVISAINQGHVYRYLSKPWQPEELEAAIADAAAEYTRISDHARVVSEGLAKVARLEADLREVLDRLARVEAENERLKALLGEKA
jgi:response regulator RpfG family c-di-GMP phosphodiesterase